MAAGDKIRAGFYIDGCNLHQGLREAKLRSLYWLNLKGFCQAFLKYHQTLVCVKYFTARMGEAGKNKRHTTYIEALMEFGGVDIIEGKFQMEKFFCGLCHGRNNIPKEKQTDVNVATSLVVDAFLDKWDTAFVVSGDADLVPPIRAVRENHPKKSVVVVSPLNRYSAELARSANGHQYANRPHYSQNQLPEDIMKGEIRLARPDKWN